MYIGKNLYLERVLFFTYNPSGQNPTWRNILRENFFDKEFQPGQCYRMSYPSPFLPASYSNSFSFAFLEFFVKVWNCNTPDGNPILVFEQPIDLNNLGYVGPGV